MCSAPRLERSELSGRAPPAAVARWLDRRSMQIRQRPRGIMEVYETGFRPPKQILEPNGMSILRGYAPNQRFWAYAAIRGRSFYRRPAQAFAVTSAWAYF